MPEPKPIKRDCRPFKDCSVGSGFQFKVAASQGGAAAAAVATLCKAAVIFHGAGLGRA